MSQARPITRRVRLRRSMARSSGGWLFLGLLAGLMSGPVLRSEGLPVLEPEAEGMSRDRLERVFDLVGGTVVSGQHVPFDQHGLFTRFRTAVMQAVE